MAKVKFGFARANSLTNRQVAHLFIASVLALGLGSFGHYYSGRTGGSVDMPEAMIAEQNNQPVAEQQVAQADGVTAPENQANTQAPSVMQQMSQELAQSAPAQAVAAVGSMAAAAIAAKPENVSRVVELDKNESFADMLTESDVPEAEAKSVMAALAKAYDLKHVKAGQEVNLNFVRRGTEETLQEVSLSPELTKDVVIARAEDGSFVAKIKVTPIERKRMAVRAEIRSSLHEAGQREGVPRNIMAALIRAYAHAVDFQRDVHPGDHFEVLYDQPTAKDGTAVGEGTIIYAALEVGGKVKPLYRVTFGDGAVDYFDAAGRSLKRALLRTPVEGARMTSGFGMRMHPLLGFSKMHKGTDFGAPTGTPIFAAGQGVIEEVGFHGAYGRYVKIRHNGRLETAYAHMSRFAHSLYQGARVNQGDVIGYVGASGRATGPHLHFEVLVDREQVNPMSVNLPVGRVLEGGALKQFQQGEDRIRKEFSNLLTRRENQKAEAAKAASPVAAAGTAANVTEGQKTSAATPAQNAPSMTPASTMVVARAADTQNNVRAR